LNWEIWYCLAVVALIFAGLIRHTAADALLLGGTILVTAAGIITPKTAFSGFTNEGMLTVAALFVVASALRETGALHTLGNFIFGGANTERGVLVRLSVSVTGMSAFLNNTPIVAMLIPVIQDWGKKHGVSPSRLLLPLSYLCILGGTCTLIGTSTNLVVNDMLTRSDHPSLEPMGFFELGKLGVPYALIGIAYLFFLGPKLLPKRADFMAQLSQSYRDYLVNLRVNPECKLIGKQIDEAGLRKLKGLFLVEIVRDGEAISPVLPNHVLHEGDILTLTGAVDTIMDLEKIPGLVPVPPEEQDDEASNPRGRSMSEAVVSGRSPAVGRSIRDGNFRARYNAAVVAVHRGSERLQGRLGDIVLQAGDTLLLQHGPHFSDANRNNPDFFLVSGVKDSRPTRHNKAILSLFLLGVLVTLMVLSTYLDWERIPSVATSAFLVAGLMVGTRCISIADARNSVDWQTLITIAAAFGMAEALRESGLVTAVTGTVEATLGPLGPYAMLLAVYILTSALTESVTNNAAAMLAFPFAVSFAETAQYDPRPFVMAVAFAASASFITPIGYQTNLMVYGPGGYKFTDFVRIGLPLHLVLMATAMFLIPVMWPF
jgi:di/tricarboxylate transporter